MTPYWTLLAALVAGVATAQSSVSVLMNDPSVVYANNGVRLAAGFGYDSTHCLGMTTLPSAGYSAGILFNGTSATITLLLDFTGGPASIYIDGSVVQTSTSDGPGTVSGTVDECDQTVVTTPTLSSGQHNLTVLNSGTGEVYLHSFVYRSLAASASVSTSIPVSTSASSTLPLSSSTSTNTYPGSVTTTSTPQPKKASNAPAIGAAIAGVVVFLLALLIIFLVRRKRQRRNKFLPPRSESTAIEPMEVVSGPEALVTPYYSVDHLPSVGSSSSFAASSPHMERSPLCPYSQTTTTAPPARWTSSDISAPTITTSSSRTRQSRSRSNPRSTTTSSRSDEARRRVAASVRNPDDRQSSAVPQQVEVIQQLLARDIPNTEISAVIRMMAGGTPNQPPPPQVPTRSDGVGDGDDDDGGGDMPPPQYQPRRDEV
ncbi:hypothetical protein FRB95_009616 [Tulasnella sp. JGI-2019a]|nr:hypothetical protein FRB95_009616 [Tulasnella sp. JGI-2019a]